MVVCVVNVDEEAAADVVVKVVTVSLPAGAVAFRRTFVHRRPWKVVTEDIRMSFRRIHEAWLTWWRRKESWGTEKRELRDAYSTGHGSRKQARHKP